LRSADSDHDAHPEAGFDPDLVTADVARRHGAALARSSRLAADQQRAAGIEPLPGLFRR
jgi:hypothetical protein